jgi:hypothetical protein
MRGIEIDTDPETGSALLRIYCGPVRIIKDLTAAELRVAAMVLNQAAENIEP